MSSRWRALAVLTLARTSMGFQFQSVASVSPQMVDALGLSFADLGLLIGLYFLPGVVVALPAGAVGQRIGDKRAVLVGLGLMALGGVVTGLADGLPALIVGRLISGIGAVVLNVMMSKMVTDWFAGREIVLAMSIFVNSFPIGVGAALAVLGWVASGRGWAAGLMLAASVAAAALVLVAAGYQRHANDRASGTSTGKPRLTPFELTMVIVAGSIWGIYNGVFSVMFGFAPSFLQRAGSSPAQVGLVVGAATWLMAASVQVGGLVAQRWHRPTLLLLVGVLAWSGALLTLALDAGPPDIALLFAGALMGLPVGVIMSLPGQVLRPENRALGMGVFYLWLYIGHGSIPPAAGWLQDHAGHEGAMTFLGALVLAIVPLYVAFNRAVARHRPG